MTATVALVSGGLDSVTLAYYLAHYHRAHPLVLVSVDYGQRHRKELEYAKLCATRVGAAKHFILPMASLRAVLGSGALVSDRPTPHGHYADPAMALTVVANRNMVLLALAVGVAIAEGASQVATAVHAGDYAIYPDCRPEFIEAMNHAVKLGNAGHLAADFRITAPFIYSTKDLIARHAAALGVPIDQTWSCYEGGDIHCGRCGTCVERQEALTEAGVHDPTHYRDPDFWRAAVANHKAGTV
jgi:7-cyano-7-deazaguanine synthase